MARTGLELLKTLKVGGFVKYHPKGDDSVYYKAQVAGIDTENELAKILAVEGPRFEAKDSKEKPFNCHMDRLKGVQGRQPGFSPAKKSGEDEDDSPAEKKGKTTPPKKDKAKKETEDSPVEYDLESAKKELKDKIEEIDTVIDTIEDGLEVLDNVKASAEAILAFLDNLKMGDTESPAAEEPKKTRTRRTRKATDEDEA